jgi:hypothetical protein
MKIIKPTDVTYDNTFNLVNIKPELTNLKSYKGMSFSYDYSIPVRKKQGTAAFTTTASEDDDSTF